MTAPASTVTSIAAVLTVAPEALEPPEPGELALGDSEVTVRWTREAIAIVGRAPQTLTAADDLGLRVSRGVWASHRGEVHVVCVELLRRGRRCVRMTARCDDPAQLEGLPWGETAGAEVALDGLRALVCTARLLDARVAHWSEAAAQRPPVTVRQVGPGTRWVAVFGGELGIAVAGLIVFTSLVLFSSASEGGAAELERAFATQATIVEVQPSNRIVTYGFRYDVPEGVDRPWEDLADQLTRGASPEPVRTDTTWTFLGQDPGHEVGDEVEIEFGLDRDAQTWRARIVGMEEARRAPIPRDETWAWLASLLAVPGLLVWRRRRLGLLARGQLAEGRRVSPTRLSFVDAQGRAQLAELPTDLRMALDEDEPVSIVYWPEAPAKGVAMRALPGSPQVRVDHDGARRVVGGPISITLTVSLWLVAGGTVVGGLLALVTHG